MHILANLIDGRQRAPRNGRYLDIVDPAQGRAFAQCPDSNRDDVSDAGFGFTASLSHDRASTQAWMLVGGYVRDAGFDGQYFDTTQDAARIFTQCSVCTTRMVETMRFAVLSQSQWSALGSCVYDGGIPLPDDAGIRAPGPTGQGYDAQHLCGEMTEQVVSDGLADGGACPAECDGCFVRYQLQGTRG